MEFNLGYIIFGIGWPVLILASLWIWQKTDQLPAVAKTFLNISLISFYALGYTCTMYWQGASWLVGVLPSFVVFLVLIIATIRGVLPGK
jgi:hypothetical protein